MSALENGVVGETADASGMGLGAPAVQSRRQPGLSDKQKALRAEGLGASEVATALGINPWKSAAELAAEKRGEMEPTEAGEAALWGQRFERPIADEFISRRRAEGKAWSIFTPPTMRHPTSKVLMATCDRIVVPEGRRARSEWLGEAEFKNFSAYRREEFGEEADAIPEPVIIQIQVQLEVTSLEDAWLGVVLGGQTYKEYPLKRDREMGGQLVEFAEKWWADHVIQGLPIEADGSEAYDKFLRRRYPTSTAGVLEAKPGHFDLVEAVRAAKAALKITEEVEADAVAKLKAAIGEAEGIAGLCTWKNNKGSPKTDWEQVAKQLHAPADLIAKFTTNRPGARVLRLTREK